jgi:hypothetical protein
MSMKSGNGKNMKPLILLSVLLGSLLELGVITYV